MPPKEPPSSSQKSKGSSTKILVKPVAVAIARKTTSNSATKRPYHDALSDDELS
jgi:hypothetical protein